jgi:hypothetical protein
MMKENENGNKIESPGLLAALDRVRLLAEEQGLAEEFFAKAQPHLDAITALLKITNVQAALFALIVERSGGEDASLAGIGRALKCGKIQAMQYIDDLEALEKKRLIISEDLSDFHHVRKLKGIDNAAYFVPAAVINALRAGREYHYTVYRNLSPEDFYEAADNILGAFKREKISPLQFRSEISYLFGGNRNGVFVKKLSEYKLSFPEQMILLYFCASLVIEDESILPLSAIRPFFLKRGKIAQRNFETGENTLFEERLLEHACDQGIADTSRYCLTATAKESFLSDVNIREHKKAWGSNIVSARDIREKELHYSNKLCRQVGELTALLREEKFAAILRRLKEQNMQTGFACLFSGPPGTGKTETAYQIARAAGRDIMLVDIAETKSMWFGESEKRIKALFDRYQGMVKNCRPAPILLFNEADAVLGRRQTLGDTRRGAGQTENAIQNIILQEMENLAGGILIATTNMTGNLDKAFERRFLYKIEFEKPDCAAKAAIWRDRIDSLDEESARVLSNRFDFSGGQIENVARKALVAGLIRGGPLSAADIAALCEEEQPGVEARRIGFVTGV